MDKDVVEKIKEMITKLVEIDDQLDNLRQEKNDMKKEYKEKYGLNMKAIDLAVSAIRKNVSSDELDKLIEAIEPIMK